MKLAESHALKVCLKWKDFENVKMTANFRKKLITYLGEEPAAITKGEIKKVVIPPMDLNDD
jgi:hypothetical protein